MVVAEADRTNIFVCSAHPDKSMASCSRQIGDDRSINRQRRDVRAGDELGSASWPFLSATSGPDAEVRPTGSNQ